MSAIKWPDELLIKLVKESINFADVCRKLGASPKGGSYCHLNKRIKNLGCDTSHFDKSNHCRGKQSNTRKFANDYLIFDENRETRQHGHILRRSLLETGRKYECEMCKNDGIWLQKEIQLEIDHIDGNWRNNLAENLRFLCPNCHSQTQTFGNKQRIAKEPKTRKIDKRRSTWPSKEELEKLLWEKPSTHIAKQYNVADTMVNKWCKAYNLIKPERGYWTKHVNS